MPSSGLSIVVHCPSGRGGKGRSFALSKIIQSSALTFGQIPIPKWAKFRHLGGNDGEFKNFGEFG